MLSWLLLASTPALPPVPPDPPEEVLVREIILEARSPLDNRLLTAAEYAELQERAQGPGQPEALLPKQLKYTVFGLQLIHFLKSFWPF